MNKQQKYFNKIKNKIAIKEKSTIAITGASGGIGSCLASYFSSYDVSIILLGRSKKKLEELEANLLPCRARITIFPLELSNIEEVKASLPKLKELNIDLFYNNAGVYHQNIECHNGIDTSFLIDYLVPIFFMKNLSINHRITFINTASISYHYHRFENDIQGLDISSKIKRYGFLKRILMMETIFLHKNRIDCYLAHPGISYTGLFSKANKAYPPLVLSLIKWPMKMLFMSPEKACLPLFLASTLHPKDELSYLGPRGLFHGWGYPSIQKINPQLNRINDLKYLDEQTNLLLHKYFSI